MTQRALPQPGEVWCPSTRPARVWMKIGKVGRMLTLTHPYSVRGGRVVDFLDEYGRKVTIDIVNLMANFRKEEL